MVMLEEVVTDQECVVAEVAVVDVVAVDALNPSPPPQRLVISLHCLQEPQSQS